MATRKALTGGTKDVNPQLLGGAVTQLAINTYLQSEIPIPVMRMGMSNSKAQVIELLWVDVFMPADNVSGTAVRVTMQLATSSQTAIVPMSDADIIFAREFWHTTLTSGAWSHEVIQRVTLHDGAGHGLIVAAPSLFLGMSTQGQTLNQTVRVKIAYRFKNVSLTEFVGLSIQQSG